jgi:hypothetical protein
MPTYTDLPPQIRKLPRDARGYPVPWFVAWKDGEPVFPAMDSFKLARAINDGLCWVCGQHLGRLSAFVVGPMCIVNRTSAEPPSHLICARWSARNCPFLTKPRMGRVPVEKYGGDRSAVAGIMLERNPGVTCVWIVKGRGRAERDGMGGVLMNIGEPHQTPEWYCEGRPATQTEVLESIETGLPFLVELAAADEDPEGAARELQRRLGEAMELMP